MGILQQLKDYVQGKAPFSAKRSSQWPRVRADHLKKHPKCSVCGSASSIEVHHIKPFHTYPDLELAPDNLVTLCETKKGGVNCHLHFGHLGNYKSFNKEVKQDCAIWEKKIAGRP